MTSLTVVSVQVIFFFFFLSFLNPKTHHQWIRSLISLLQMDINLTTRGQSSFSSAIQFAFFLSLFFFLFKMLKPFSSLLAILTGGQCYVLAMWRRMWIEEAFGFVFSGRDAPHPPSRFSFVLARSNTSLPQTCESPPSYRHFTISAHPWPHHSNWVYHIATLDCGNLQYKWIWRNAPCMWSHNGTGNWHIGAI